MNATMSHATDLKWRVFTSREAARTFARKRNADPKEDLYVIVEGPDDFEWTVMPLTDAIGNDFLYEWVV